MGSILHCGEQELCDGPIYFAFPSTCFCLWFANLDNSWLSILLLTICPVVDHELYVDWKFHGQVFYYWLPVLWLIMNYMSTGNTGNFMAKHFIIDYLFCGWSWILCRLEISWTSCQLLLCYQVLFFPWNKISYCYFAKLLLLEWCLFYCLFNCFQELCSGSRKRPSVFYDILKATWRIENFLLRYRRMTSSTPLIVDLIRNSALLKLISRTWFVQKSSP